MNAETQNDLHEAGVTLQGQDFKHDTGKVLWSCLSRGCATALNKVAEVLTFGANKYRRDTWRTLKDAEVRYEDALDRHLNAWKRGEDNDPESGLSHLAHAACNLLFLLELHDSAVSAQKPVGSAPEYSWRDHWKNHLVNGKDIEAIEPWMFPNGSRGFRVKCTRDGFVYTNQRGVSTDEEGVRDGLIRYNLIKIT